MQHNHDKFPRWTILINTYSLDGQSFEFPFTDDLPIQIVYIVSDNHASSMYNELSIGNNTIASLLLLDCSKQYHSLVQTDTSSERGTDKGSSHQSIVLVRPDGHVTDIFFEEEHSVVLEKIQKRIQI